MTGSDDRTPERRRGRPGHDRASVLRGAIDLFNRKGYDATSIADLAAELGVSKSAIFHHVSSKEDLLAAALDEAMGQLTELVDGATESSGSTAAERLRTTMGEAVRILADHLPAVTLLLRVRGNSPLESAALARRRHVDERLTALVRAAAAEGSVRADISPEVIARLLFGMVNSLTEWYSPDGPLDADAIADAVTSLAFDGVTPHRRGRLPFGRGGR